MLEGINEQLVLDTVKIIEENESRFYMAQYIEDTLGPNYDHVTDICDTKMCFAGWERMVVMGPSAFYSTYTSRCCGKIFLTEAADRIPQEAADDLGIDLGTAMMVFEACHVRTVPELKQQITWAWGVEFEDQPAVQA